jgi:hypothetical protein
MTDLDNHLAEFTDQVLANSQRESGGRMSQEEQVVLRLRQIVAPEANIDPAFRRKLTNRLNQEWDTSRRTRSRSHSTIRLRPRHLYTLAATIVAALIGLTFLLNDGVASPESSAGTAYGAELYFVIGFMAAGILFTALFYWWSSRKS